MKNTTYVTAFKNLHSEGVTSQDLTRHVCDVAEVLAANPGAKFATVAVPLGKTVFYADCDEFDNHATGFYTSKRAALQAFKEESLFWFSDSAKARCNPYVREEETTPETVMSAIHLAFGGSPSPAFGIGLLT